MRGSFRGPDETLRSHFSPHRRKISTREANGLNRCSDMLVLLMRLSIVPTEVQRVYSTLPTLHCYTCMSPDLCLLIVFKFYLHYSQQKKRLR